MGRPFRFAVQAVKATSAAQWAAFARRTEELGYATLFLADHYLGQGPALERAPSFGATSFSLTRSEEDHLHFIQMTTWENRADFDRFWASDEVADAREAAGTWFNKPVYPVWHVLIAAERD